MTRRHNDLSWTCLFTACRSTFFGSEHACSLQHHHSWTPCLALKTMSMLPEAPTSCSKSDAGNQSCLSNQFFSISAGPALELALRFGCNDAWSLHPCIWLCWRSDQSLAKQSLRYLGRKNFQSTRVVMELACPKIFCLLCFLAGWSLHGCWLVSA